MGQEPDGVIMWFAAGHETGGGDHSCCLLMMMFFWVNQRGMGQTDTSNRFVEAHTGRRLRLTHKEDSSLEEMDRLTMLQV